MCNFQVGETVAVKIMADQNLTNLIVYTSAYMQEYYNLHYKQHSCYKRCKIKKVKRLWYFYFKRMYLLDDGWWYSTEQLTPIVRVKAIINNEEQEAIA
ncbi:hypothetical protein AWW72_18120 [Acinetobacter sp. NRRL B-65365]|uniref:hypothetical protein n=1 Tax=Acinetobacter sp. NRRL B-65365 TaxID=1785092 RepID=UPI00079FF277|nr:hypothetical protein [Acinetobacter sp. NRRL B-65365]KYQ82523.1 hypothetical protein AWW72_18120 [Acinetobacter sp. NRRL B-65365]